MESFFTTLAIIGIVLIIFGFLVAGIFDDHPGIGVFIIFFGILSVIVGFTADYEKTQVAVNAAAEKQGTTLVTDDYSRHYLYKVIYGDCKIGAELQDGQLILAGSEPAKVLTSELVQQICEAETAR